MGAKMMPIAKKMGRTVLGVKIGLSRSERLRKAGFGRRGAHCHAFNRCWRNAVSAQVVRQHTGRIVPGAPRGHTGRASILLRLGGLVVRILLLYRISLYHVCLRHVGWTSRWRAIEGLKGRKRVECLRSKSASSLRSLQVRVRVATRAIHQTSS